MATEASLAGDPPCRVCSCADWLAWSLERCVRLLPTFGVHYLPFPPRDKNPFFIGYTHSGISYNYYKIIKNHRLLGGGRRSSTIFGYGCSRPIFYEYLNTSMIQFTNAHILVLLHLSSWPMVMACYVLTIPGCGSLFPYDACIVFL